MPSLRHPLAAHVPFRLACLAALTLLCGAPEARSQDPPEIINVGIGSDDMIRISGDRVAFRAYETQEGKDLNGDGDTNDPVLHLYDDADGSITNLGLAQSVVMSATDLHLKDDILAFVVYEPRQGTNLNGDTTLDDFVPHVYDIETATTTNLGLEGRHPIRGEGFLAFLVREGMQEQDLNGDSDQEDSVAHVFDIATAATSNLGLTSYGPGFSVGTTIAAFWVPESTVDLNGDGDLSDRVTQLYDATTGTILNPGLATLAADVAGRFVALLVSEADQGTDLNGDSDTNDRVLFLYDGDTGTTTNVGLWTEGLALTERLAAFTVPEALQGTDLNGDGDLLDRGLHIFDRASGTITNLGLAPTSLAAAGAWVAFGVSEWAQGGTDLNGDGDADDAVLHVYDADSATTTDLGLAINPVLAMDDSLLMVRVFEAGQGDTDLNGDGDTSDLILHAVDLVDRSITNLGLIPFTTSQVVNRRFGFNVKEAEVGQDLNGDGDMADNVIHLYDGVQGALHNLKLATVLPGPVLGEKFLAFAVREQTQGTTDLNGDGDFSDTVLHVARLAEPTPEELIGDLIDIVVGLELKHGPETALVVKLEHALAALAAGDIQTAEQTLGAFINLVSAQAGKKITREQADTLIARAEDALAAIAASGP